jgi:hypothetical protein
MCSLKAFGAASNIREKTGSENTRKEILLAPIRILLLHSS